MTFFERINHFLFGKSTSFYLFFFTSLLSKVSYETLCRKHCKKRETVMIVSKQFQIVFLNISKYKKNYVLDVFVSSLASFQNNFKLKNLFSTRSTINTHISKSLINSSRWVNFDVAFSKKNSKYKKKKKI